MKANKYTEHIDAHHELLLSFSQQRKKGFICMSLSGFLNRMSHNSRVKTHNYFETFMELIMQTKTWQH